MTPWVFSAEAAGVAAWVLLSRRCGDTDFRVYVGCMGERMMVWRVSGAFVGALLAGAGAFGQTAPWHPYLSYPGGGYWTVRVPVEVENTSGQPLAGMPVSLTVQEGDGTAGLIGEPAASLRVLTAAGQEYLFDVREPAGVMKRAGTLAPGDVVTMPVEAAAGARASLFLYAGNPEAWSPVDWLNAGLDNPGFEGVAGWAAASIDASHRMAFQEGGAHGGAQCARCEVDPGAASEWVKYAQDGIPVAQGQRYRFTAWVRAENVAGKAGWFVHVNGVRPQMVNQAAGWDGTFDWREVVLEFDVPEGGQTFSCGTVLYGTGTAWYDDARFERLSEQSGITVKIGPAERMELDSDDASPAWLGQEWELRAPIVLRNFTDEPAERLFGVDTRQMANQQFKFAGNAWNARIEAVDGGGNPVAVQGSFREDLLVAAGVPPRTEKRVWLYTRKVSEKEARFAGQSQGVEASSSLSASGLNLVANGGMERGEGEIPEAWEFSEEGLKDGGRFRMRRVPGGVDGQWRLELRVPETTGNPDWFGWRQRVNVKPNTQYLLSGFIKGEALDGSASIHVHKHRADGSLTESPFLSTGPAISGSGDWTQTRQVFTTPSDCAYIVVHLTMNCHGTLWHDALTLMESGTGVVGHIESNLAEPLELHAWAVNPLVKTFPHDLMPQGASGNAAVYAARNTRKSFQLAVRSPRDDAVTVDVSGLTGPGGAALAAPAAWLAEYVPIDFPIGYHSTTAPEYCRLLPEGRGNDGWAGLWPDALIPLEGPVPLAGGETKTFWFDLDVPADATPGTYAGRVVFRGREKEIAAPVTVTVWNFTVPAAKQLPALYDLRNGPGWNIAGGNREEGMRRWCDFLARYNVSPALTVDSPAFGLENGKVTMETAAFDAYASYVLDELKVNALYTPHDFYACGWAYEPRDFLGFKAFTPEYVQAWTDAYRMFIEHITGKGWRGKFVHYLSDEPFESSEKTITGLARIADMARSVAPDVPVYSSTWHYIKGLEGHLTLWGVGLHESFPLEKMRERQAAGDRFWFTTDGHMCTDTPFLGVERLLPWLCLKYGVQGYEFWGVSWWTYDPHACGWHKYIRQSNEGHEFYWVRYPNGDGFLAYPQGEDHAGTPLPTIRLVAAREGVDDYELFTALRKHADAGNAEAKAALERVLAAVAMTKP
ncbi:MAG TPA: DUF4091 domain-containing protein, partial [Candidatus Hydrogenedentes bacterium]|nr:DUF4091 domain-containing protein [Candidatus Hydrogenedentota bacterium]